MPAKKTQRTNGAGAKKTTKFKPSTKRSRSDRAKKELTADEQLLRAWRKTYDNRHPA